MKYLFTTVLAFAFFTSFAQLSNQTDKLNFCGKELKIPTGCKAPSEYEVSCDNYSMGWVYMNQEMLKTFPDENLKFLETRLANFAKVPISCYLLGSAAKGYKISYSTSTGIMHQIYAYGNVGGKSVVFQLLLQKDPINDADIPEFPKQIFRFTL